MKLQGNASCWNFVLITDSERKGTETVVWQVTLQASMETKEIAMSEQ